MSTTQPNDNATPLILDDHLSTEDEREHVSLIFRDGLDLPILGLQLIVTLPSGIVHQATSTIQGAITLPVANDKVGQAKVEIKDETGQFQEVCTLDLARCTNAVIIHSQKVKVDTPLRPHQQTPPPSCKPMNTPSASVTTEPWWSANGSLEKAWERLIDTKMASGEPPTKPSLTPLAGKTLNSAGQPVAVVVGPECPNPDGLRLGAKNNRYRAAILEAAKRLGLIPQAICALIDCEADKVKEFVAQLDTDGKPIYYTKGKKKGQPIYTEIRELWNANSINPSGAAGMTQFMPDTWLEHVLKPGYYIHDQSVSKGWVKQEPTKKGGSHWVFALGNGKTTTTPGKNRSDTNVTACLAMRMDSTWSINAAADYGRENLKYLESKGGFKINGLNDMDKAKLMYTMHHEGANGGVAFVGNKLGGSDKKLKTLKKTFSTQFGGKEKGEALANKKIESAGGNIEVAYRFWLASYIDTQFSGVSKYFCSSPQSCRSISEIFLSIGGIDIVAPTQN